MAEPETKLIFVETSLEVIEQGNYIDTGIYVNGIMQSIRWSKDIVHGTTQIPNCSAKEKGGVVTTLGEALSRYNARQDEDGRIHLSCLCDGTLIFMEDMLQILNHLRCTDIKKSHEIITEGVPKDKPWCNCLFKASGIPYWRREK